MAVHHRSGGPRWISRALKRLDLIAGRMGVSIVYDELDDQSGIFVPDDMIVYIDHRIEGKDRINYLLHELGHVSIYIDALTRDRFNVFDDDALTPRQRLTLVEEEFEAWHRGKGIARVAGIMLDESFEIIREQSLMSYMKWCASDGYAKHEHSDSSDSCEAKQ
jgi:hypothetical protein